MADKLLADAMKAVDYCFSFDFPSIKDPKVIDALKRIRNFLNVTLPNFVEQYTEDYNEANPPSPTLYFGDEVWTDTGWNLPARRCAGSVGNDVIGHIARYKGQTAPAHVADEVGSGANVVHDVIIDPCNHVIEVIKGPGGGSGYSGYSGCSGYSGYSGYSGLSGYSGYSGFSGYSGYSGLSGYSGYSGFSGHSGYSGYSSSGYSGWSGWSGLSGWSAHSGWSGLSGWSAHSGWSGYSGFSNPYVYLMHLGTSGGGSGLFSGTLWAGGDGAAMQATNTGDGCLPNGAFTWVIKIGATYYACENAHRLAPE